MAARDAIWHTRSSERSSSGAIRSTDSRNRRSEATGACQAPVLTSSAEHPTVPEPGGSRGRHARQAAARNTGPAGSSTVAWGTAHNGAQLTPRQAPAQQPRHGRRKTASQAESTSREGFADRRGAEGVGHSG